MRLIDADKLAEYIAENEQAFVFTIKSKDLTMLEDIILDIPTDYDVNKVVEQLKLSSKTALGLAAERIPAFRFIAPALQMLIDKCFEEAIRIVKAGGTDADG